MLFRVSDMVVVVAGRDRGVRGKLLKVDRDKNRVVVEGVSRAYKHVRKSQRNPQGGRLSKEMAIDASNVMFFDEGSGKPTRMGVRYLDDGSKERYAKRTGKAIDVISPPRKLYANKTS